MVPAPGNDDYDLNSTKWLRILLEKRRIPAKGLTRKAQLVTALEDHDAILERKRRAQGAERQGLRLSRMRLDNYRACTNDALDRLAIQGKLIVRPSTCARLIDALEKGDISWRSRPHQTPKQKALDLRRAKRGGRLMDQYGSLCDLLALLFRHEFSEEQRKGSMSLPREVRDMIYQHVFCIPDITNKHAQVNRVFDLQYDANSNRFWPLDNLVNACECRRTIDALLVLGSLDKDIRREAKATFWSMTDFKLRADGVYAHRSIPLQASHMFAITSRFFAGIGYEGSYGLKRLIVHEWSPMNLSTQGNRAFAQTMRHVADCASLTTLRLVLDVSLMIRGDKVGLENVLLRGKAMESSGLQTLKQSFCSLLHMREVEIIPYHRKCLEMVRSMTQEKNLFLRWAYTDERRLWFSLIARVKLQRITLRQQGMVIVQYPEDLQKGMISSHLAEGGCHGSYGAWLLAQCKAWTSDYKEWLGEQV